MVGLLIVCMALTSAPVFTQENAQAGVLDMARYYPDDTVAFAAIRTDDAYIRSLDGLIEAVTAPFASLGVPPINLSQGFLLLTQSTFGEMSWVGDHAAVGAVGLPGANGVCFTLEIDDAERAADSLRAGLANTDFAETISDDSVITFSNSDGAHVILTDSELYITRSDTTPYRLGFERETDLRDNQSFQDAIGALPEPGYNALVYIDGFFVQSSLGLYQSGFGFYPSGLGLTVLNDDTLVIDAITLTDFALGQPIDPEFARYIPADAGAVIHATDFTNFYDNTLMATGQNISEFNARQFGGDALSMEVEFEAAFARIGIDIRADVLSWTTGDYALFARAEPVEIVRGFLTNKVNVNGLYDFGAVIEATDPALAGAFSDQLVELLTTAFSRTDRQVMPTPDTIGDTSVSILSFAIPLETDYGIVSAEAVQVEIVIGTNDDIFFVGTRGAIESILAGESSLADQAFYQDAQAYLLPDPTSVWVTDGEGFIIGVGNPVIILGLIGPAVGNNFQQITPTPTPTPDPVIIDAQLQPLQDVIDLVRHSTISSTITDVGYTQVRITLTLNLPN